MNCPTCGKENESSAHFCGSCGANLISPGATGEAELPRVGFIDAIQRAFEKYFDFTGRATRAEFWWFYLFALIVNIVASILDEIIGASGAFYGWGLFSLVGGLALACPYLAVGARRLHDINKSGWWQLLWLPLSIIIVGLIVIIVWWVKKGDKGPNNHGADPRTSPS